MNPVAYDCSFGKCPGWAANAFNLFQYGDVAGGHGFAVQIGANQQSITVAGASTSTPVSVTPVAGFAAPAPTNNASVSNGSWHLLDITYDGNTVDVYQDAQLIGGGQMGDAGTVLPGQGLQVNAEGPYFGLDEVAIYPSVLTSAEIAAHWTAGAGTPSVGACAPTPTSPYAAAVLADSPAAYYRLDELSADPQDRVAFDSSSHCANAAYTGSLGLTSASTTGALLGDSDTAVSG